MRRTEPEGLFAGSPDRSSAEPSRGESSTIEPWQAAFDTAELTPAEPIQAALDAAPEAAEARTDDRRPAGRGHPLRRLVSFLDKTAVIAGLEARKLRHDPTELFTRAVQPALWLVVFGQVFTRLRAIPTGNLRYVDFMAPGILAQSVLFIAIFFGIAIIWERDLGVIHKFLVSPTPRTALVLGKALSAGVRAVAQAAIVYLLALVLSVRMNWNPAALAGVLLSVLLGAALFSTFSLVIACLVKTRERFMGIGQVITMPLFFASNAIYPIQMMPHWLQLIARLNPLSYQEDSLRALMLAGGSSAFGLGLDYLVLIGVSGLLVVVAARLYPRVVV